MNRDEKEGRKDSVKGRVKEAAGALLDDPGLQERGADERARGEAQETLGRVRRKAGEALEELGEKLKR